MASRPEQLPTAAGLTLSNEEDERTDSSDASTDIEREQSICHLKNVDSLFRLRRSAGFAFPRSALHAVGLKFSTPKYPYRTPQGKERPKVLINTLRRIAVARATVHLLPTIISTLIIAGNAVPLVNGPDITIEAKFFLQAASKFHELAIMGSLAAVIADAIRYQLINNELEFALLPSAFQFSTASFLWSQGFLATLRQPPYPLRKVAFLFLLIICILLGAIAGPASALLFIPTQGWLDAGSTDFYLRGSESDLWPQHLTTDLIAPECLGSRLSLSVKCPGGGWEGVREGYHYAGADEDWRWDTFALDHKDPRIIHTFDHRNSNSSHDYGVWSIAPHLATANVATLVHDHHNKAWLHATGMKRKIRDAGVWMAITDGKHPVVRTSCGPNVQVTGEDIKLPFPIIKDYIWNMETGFKQWDIKAEWILPKSNESLPRDDTTILHTTWVAPPEGNGEATAGLIVALVNDTTTVVRACAIDARWSGGAIEVHHGSYLNSYLTHLDTQLPPKELLFGMPYYRLPPPEGANSTLSKTITADPGWVESIAPHTVQEIHGIEGSITNFEEMLLYTWSGTMYFNLDKTNDRRGALFLERAVSMYFVNALSRVGLHRQFAKFDTVKFHPNLTLGWEDNDAFLRGGPIFERPQNDSYSVLRQRWYTYGTAWQLTGSSSRISIATLGMHMAIALLHCIVMVRTAQTSEAWDSILDMIALAFNSIPRGNPLENCGTGVMLNETLKQRVRVRAVRNNKDTNRKVELVFSDDTDETLSRGQSPRDPNLKPIEAGRYYG